jgi:uncharacterized radical SAM superfamily Fe-S cluster-containing enzyme
MKTLAEVEKLLDITVKSEGTPDVVQISGGEPTIHPQFFEILDAAKRRPIRHLMVNTNGLRIAKELAFAKRLKDYSPGFEIYLQFDSLELEPLMALRGTDLRAVRRQALDHLNEFNISTTLVVTLKKGLNDGEIGKIIDFALKEPSVRGVTFQPIQDAGRNEDFNPATDRLTLTEVRRGIYTQSNVFKPEDIIPVPCHPDALAMAYALKLDGKVIPLTGMIAPKILIDGGSNTIAYEKEPGVRDQLFKLFSLNHSPDSSASTLKELLCCLPKLLMPGQITYDNLFRVIIMQFMDAHAFQPDGRMIPFDTFNLFYRGNLEQKRLAPLRAIAESLNRMALPVLERR